MHVLIVEDDPSLALTLEVGLKQAGHDILGPVSTCQEARALLEGCDHRDVIALIDVNLADGAKGTELAKELSKASEIPCLFTTGEANAAYLHAATSVGVLPKPYRISDVVAAIDAVICKTSGRDPFHFPTGLVLFDSAKYG